MPSFILRKLDPIFWAKVQAKAKAEDTTVKALILKLLTQWLGVLLLAGMTAACMEGDYTSAPLSPTSLGGTEIPAPTPTIPVVAPLHVSLSIGRATPEVGDSISFVATTGSPITSAAWSFGNGATQQTARGETAYAYPAIGTFLARVTVTAGDGRTATDQASVTIRRPPSPPDDPSDDDTPTSTPSGYVVTVACAPEAAGTSMPCNVNVSYDNVRQPSDTVVAVHWDFGDGVIADTVDPVTAHTYAGAGNYTVFAMVKAQLPAPPVGPGGFDTKTASTPVTIP